MWEILGVVTDAKGGGTAADEGLGCIQGQDLPFEKLLHLQSTPPPPQECSVPGVRMWCCCTQSPLQPPLESRS